MNETLSVEVTVEQSSATVAYPWSFSDTDEPRRIRLHGATSDEAIGSVMVTICEYNTIATADTPETVFENILADANLVLPGGLQFSRNGVPVVVPGCCSGIEEWREWLGVLDGGSSAWGGHDPSPWVELRGETYRLWADEGESAAFLDLDRTTLAHLLRRAEADLQEFVLKLRGWAMSCSPLTGERLARHFAHSMNI